MKKNLKLIGKRKLATKKISHSKSKTLKIQKTELKSRTKVLSTSPKKKLLFKNKTSLQANAEIVKAEPPKHLKSQKKTVKKRQSK